MPRAVLNDTQAEAPEHSYVVRERVEQCCQLQLKRGGKRNALLVNREVENVCKLSKQDAELLEQAIDKLGLSARAYHRILKVARTIADLAGEDQINTAHLSEAIGYRRLDRVVQGH